MITSHGYQTMSDDAKLDTDLKIVRDIMTDPFGGGSTGGTPPPANMQQYANEDDYDMGQMQMQCMGEDMQYGSYMMNQHMYQQQHMGMQQHWGQQHYMNGGGGYYDQYNNYGYGQQMYQQHPQMQHQQQVGMVPGGGPSPGGSHNTPSPQALSESDGDEHSIRNNNILKRPSPNGDSYSSQQVMLQQQQMGMGHPGHMGPPHVHNPHALQHVHPHHHPHMHHPMMSAHPSAGMMATGPPVPKKPKVSKRKKKRDPNEPQKPVSAYALFFRDSQASIKAANPNAAFGDVSKIVASMWDGLDPESKAAYKKRTENAKKDYLKKLAAYRASLVSKGSGPGDGNLGYGTFGSFSGFGSESNLIHHSHHTKPYMTSPGGGSGSVTSAGGVTSASGSPGSGGYLSGQPVPPRPPLQAGSHPSQMTSHISHHPGGNYMNMHGTAMQNGMMGAGLHHGSMSHHGPPHPISPLEHGVSQTPPASGVGSSSPAGSNASQGTPATAPTSSVPTSSSASPTSNTTSGINKRCGRPGCTNPVQGWTNSEFCSNECVVGQCREVYTHWTSTASAGGSQSNATSQQFSTANGSTATNRTTTPVK